MKALYLQVIVVLLVLQAGASFAQGDRCSTVQPFCAGDSQLVFPNSNVSNGDLQQAEFGPNYQCLLTQPYPAWFYLQVADPGDLVFTIRQTQNPDGTGATLDVDFIVWGPFGIDDDICSSSALSSQNIVDCSYSPSAVETMRIPNALQDEVYLVLITNFSAQPGFISLQQTNTGGSTDCSIVGDTLGPDQKLCNESSYVLDATTTSASEYIWYVFNKNTNEYDIIPGETNPTLTVVETGNYQVTIKSEILNDEATDDVTIEFFTTPQVTSEEAVTGCGLGEGVGRFDLLTAAPGLVIQGGSQETYTMNFYLTQEDFEQGLSISNAEDYEGGVGTILGTLVGEISGCESQPFEIELTIEEPPMVNLNEITAFCLDLNANIVSPVSLGEDLGPGYLYEWNVPNDPDGDGVQNPILTLTEYPSQTTLILTVQNIDTGCSYTYSTEIKAFSPPREVLVEVEGNDFTGGGYQLTATATGGLGDEPAYEYSIDNGPWQESPVFTGVTGGTHRITARDIYGCGSATSAAIRLIGYPRFFTPNNDGYNDTWNVINDTGYSITKVYIFDRYGKLLKQLNPRTGGWDGTFNNLSMPASDYWFLVEYVDPETGELQEFKGHFTLMR